MDMGAGRADETMEECVVDVENTTLYSPLAEAEEAQWAAHCIYRVPARMKNLDAGHAYKPQTVSLGPFHHGDPDLLPMEGHKQRAVRHVARRAGKMAGEFVAALEEVAEQLESAYMDLGDDWRGPGNRGRFLQVMITDGCFLLEVMRTAAGKHVEDYARNDPVFGPHGQQFTMPYIQEDMHKLENQLPLLVLQRIVDVETENSSVNDGRQEKDESINMMVLKFMSSSCGLSTMAAGGLGLGLHPLDISRRSMLFEPYMEVSPCSEDTAGSSSSECDDSVSSRLSAMELHEAGIRFDKSNKGIFQSIRFDPERGLLIMPFLLVDDSTEHMLLNMMAFERLHVTATYGVTRYVLFMEEIVKSSKDVALLRKKKLIDNAVGPDEEVARMFNRLTRGVLDDSDGPLNHVHEQMNQYLRNDLRRMFNKWWGHLVHTYFRSPWTAISLLAATVILALAVVQTVCAVLTLDSDKD